MPNDTVDYKKYRDIEDKSYSRHRWTEDKKTAGAAAAEESKRAFSKDHPHYGETNVGGIWTNDPSLLGGSRSHKNMNYLKEDDGK